MRMEVSLLRDIFNRDLKLMMNCNSQYSLKLPYTRRGWGSLVGGDGRKHLESKPSDSTLNRPQTTHRQLLWHHCFAY